MDDLQAKKIGVIFNPPTLLLLYKIGNKYKKLCMPVRELSVTSDCSVLAARLQARHKKQMSTINIISIERMIRLIQEVMKGHSKSAALDIVASEYQLNPDEDLNTLTDKQLNRRKAIMDLNFKKNNIDKDHPDYVYDKEVVFEGEKKTSNWDTSDEESFKLEANLYPINKGPTSDKVLEENENYSPGEEKSFDALDHANPIPNESVENDQINSNNSIPKSIGEAKDLKDFKYNSVEEENEGGEDKISNGFLSELTRSLDDKKTPPSFTKPPLPKPLGLSKSPLDLSKPLGPPKALLQPLQSLPPLSRTPLHKTLPPLDLPKLNSKCSLDEDDGITKNNLNGNSKEKESISNDDTNVVVTKDLKDNVETASSDEESDLLPLNINVDKPSKGFDRKEEKKLILEDDFNIEEAKNRYDQILQANKKMIENTDEIDFSSGKSKTVKQDNVVLSDEDISISEENKLAEIPSKENSKINDIVKSDLNIDLEESDSFSDGSDNILPGNDSLYKANKTKSLFGLQSDEEIAENVPSEKSEKCAKKDEATPRSISAADVETGEESDFW